jgi:16S rRNA (guanine527-N7)-methyltransferase
VDTFIDQCFTLSGRKITPEQAQAFQVYEDELVAWNEKYNLTAIRSREEIRVKHFLDSLTCFTQLGDIRGLSLIDIGTGAGFPGLPIKIVDPQVVVTLADSVGKKLDFCAHIIDTLQLENIRCIQSRAEDLGQDVTHREHYDRVVARAVAGLPVLAEYVLPLLKVGGKGVIQKGSHAPSEVTEAGRAIDVLGGRILDVSQVVLPGVEEIRYLISVEKIKPSPREFPRRAGLPSKNPIV